MFADDRRMHIASERSGLKPKTPIDLGVLSEQTWSDADLQRELLRLFLDQRGSFQACLTGRAARSDVTAALHRLKGSAGSLGAMQVANLAAQAELRLEAASTIGDEALQQALGELSTALFEACEFAALLLRRP